MDLGLCWREIEEAWVKEIEEGLDFKTYCKVNMVFKTPNSIIVLKYFSLHIYLYVDACVSA